MLSEKVKDACGVAILFLCLASGAKWLFPNSGTPPSGRTGSPGDSSADCSGCHSGSSQSNSSSLSLSGLPADGWRASTTYNLTLAFSPPTGSRFGFEMTAEKSGGSKMGSWTAGSGNQVVSTNWLGHSSAGSQNSWSFSWAAPSAGNGTVTFYAVGNAANSNGGTSGDTIHLKSFALGEDTSLPTPTNFAGETISTTSLKWTWTDNASDETGYRVYASSGGKIAGDLAASTTFFVWSSLTENTSYQTNVKAYNANGESQASGSATRYTLANPPSGLAFVAVASTTIQISWTPSAAKTYWLERSSVSASGSFVHIATATASPYTDSSLASLTTYHYRVRGLNGDDLTTAYDTVITTRTLASAPSKPVFSGVVLSTAVIKWSWNAQDNVTTFEVRPSSGGILASLVGATTFWLETNLQPATTYQRFVRAANPLGSADSDSVILATPQSASAVAVNVATTVVASDQKTSVEIPSGALGGTGAILISLDPETKPIAVNSQDITAATNKLSSSVSLIANSLREFSAIIGDARKTDNFGAAVTITLPYTDNDSNGIVDNTTINAGALSIYSLDETAQSWASVAGSTLNRSAKTVSAAVNHFSVFSLIGTAASSSLGSIKIFPNPFRPSTGASVIRFQNLTSEATIKIYSLSGELLATLNKRASDGNEKSWNATTDSGERLASGVYLALVESSGEEKILKLAIER